MKNVTGYDLVKLMAGSHGTLGVMSEVSFKVLPKPDAMESIEIKGLSDEIAVQAMASAMGSPFDVSGALHAPGCIEGEPTTLIRVEGFSGSVKYRAGRLVERLSKFGDVARTDAPESWSAAQNLSVFAQAKRGLGGAVWSVTLKPSDAPALMAPLHAKFGCLYDFNWAGGRIHVWLGSDGDQAALHGELQDSAAMFGGHARLLNGPPELADNVPVFQPETLVLAKLAQGLRAKFDPLGILNPGLMGT